MGVHTGDSSHCRWALLCWLAHVLHVSGLQQWGGGHVTCITCCADPLFCFAICEGSSVAQSWNQCNQLAPASFAPLPKRINDHLDLATRSAEILLLLLLLLLCCAVPLLGA
jgi:hypothetical protein